MTIGLPQADVAVFVIADEQHRAVVNGEVGIFDAAGPEDATVHGGIDVANARIAKTADLPVVPLAVPLVTHSASVWA